MKRKSAALATLHRKIMLQPTPNDVLSGRGASFNRHPGNIHFRGMLEKKRVSAAQPPLFDCD